VATMAEENTSASTEASPWTDEQESALLRAVIQFKPVGMHKHFRMIAIRDYMFNQGVISPEDAHTTARGIWEKLKSLYDLAKLDEREDSIVNDGVDESGEVVAYWRDFELPREDFEALMWERRLAPDGTQSPGGSRRESTVADTDEPRSSPVSGRGSVRGGRSSGRRSGRLSKLQNELETQKSSRRTSKAASVVDEDHVMEEAPGDEEGQDSGNEAEDESDGPEEEGGKKSSGRKAVRSAKKGKTRRGRRR